MDQTVPTNSVRQKVAYLPSFDDGNGWYNILPKPKPPRVLAGSHLADWLVIGSGYAGLS
ncbi:MAG: hypothetical protein H7X89_12905, partial [Rhizobiales bacterium]|nr:hypothetical protein [Hyphomicrobiales bacterium]